MVRPRSHADGSARPSDQDTAAPLVAQVDWSDGDFHGKATNISMKGLFVETEIGIDVGIAVMVEFSVVCAEGLERVVVSGQVARSFDAKDTFSGRMRSGVGIRFEMFLDGKRELARFIKERVQRAGARRDEQNDRRRHPRVAVSLPVSWRAPTRRERHGYLLRMPAPGSFALESTTLVPTGTKLKINMELPAEDGPQERIEAWATVSSLISSPEQAGGMVVDLDLSPVELALVSRYAKHYADAPSPP